MTQDIPSLRHPLVKLKALHESDVLAQAQYGQGKATLERRVLDLVMRGATDAAPATAVAAAPRQSRKLVAMLTVSVLVAAAAGYWYTGSPDQLTLDTQASIGSGTANAGQTAPHATGQEEIATMAEKLDVRMKDTPEDAKGWTVLARLFTVLGRHPEALVAYEKAVKLRQDDAPLLADYADSLAVNNGGTVAGKPVKWVEAALKLDPRNIKALALAGAHAYDLKDYASAVKYWEQVLQFGPPDDGYVQQVQAGLEQARQLGGLPASSGATAAAAPAMVLPGGSVSGKVSLSADLAQLASPDDTVFIYARAADGGPRMPLAIQRLKVKDLPVSFMLDDSSSMSPAALISGVKRVIVSARISKSGQAVPTPGDLTGQSAPVAVGETGLVIEIREQVK
jgi:cytochrome c-type biogenesis protein CcmH